MSESESELERRREQDCRLKPDRALADLREAAAWIRERGMVTGRPCCSLPSLHVAIHEEPYAPGKGGFAEYPKTKWWWGGALAERPDVTALKLHRGKTLLVADRIVAVADPLCRGELARAEAGEHGPEARRLVEHLAAAGPTLGDDLKVELGLDARSLRALRTKLERIGVVVARQVVVPAKSGGHSHTSELLRWDQLRPEEPSGPGGIEELVVAGVAAAVLAPEAEVGTWFSWPVSSAAVDRLVAAGRLTRVAGRLSAGRRAS